MYLENLSPATSNRLLVFHTLIQNKQSLNSLAEALTIPKRTIKHHIQALNIDINEIFFHENFIKVDSKGEYYINELFSNKSLLLFYQLKLHYLKKTLQFSLLTLLTTNTSLRISEVLSELFISSSYLYRLIKKINQKLRPFDFQIVKNGSEILLAGHELSIRIFSYLFLYDSFQNLEWPFQQCCLTKEEVKTHISEHVSVYLDNASDTKKNSLYFLSAVLILRIRNGNLAEDLEENLSAILKLIQQNYQLQSFKYLDTKQNRTESYYFNFLVGIFVSDLISTDKMRLLGQLFSQSNYPETALAKELIYSLKNDFKGNFTIDTQYIFIYFFTLRYIFFKLAGPKISLFSNLFFPKQDYELTKSNRSSVEIQQFYESFTSAFRKTEHQDLLMNPRIKEYFFSSVDTFLQMGTEATVFIYLQLTKDYTTLSYVTKQIETIFNPETVRITTNFQKANLIITDTLESSKNYESVFFLSSIKNYTQWQELVHKIQQLLLRKLFNNESLKKT